MPRPIEHNSRAPEALQRALKIARSFPDRIKAVLQGEQSPQDLQDLLEKQGYEGALIPFIEVVNQLLKDLKVNGYQVSSPVDTNNIDDSDFVNLSEIDPEGSFLAAEALKAEHTGHEPTVHPPLGYLISLNGESIVLAISFQGANKGVICYELGYPSTEEADAAQANDLPPAKSCHTIISTDIEKLRNELEEFLREKLGDLVEKGLKQQTPDSTDEKIPEDLSIDEKEPDEEEGDKQDLDEEEPDFGLDGGL